MLPYDGSSPRTQRPLGTVAALLSRADDGPVDPLQDEAQRVRVLLLADLASAKRSRERLSQQPASTHLTEKGDHKTARQIARQKQRNKTSV